MTHVQIPKRPRGSPRATKSFPTAGALTKCATPGCGHPWNKHHGECTVWVVDKLDRGKKGRFCRCQQFREAK
jgi:hypothetical protein